MDIKHRAFAVSLMNVTLLCIDEKWFRDVSSILDIGGLDIW